MRVETVHALRQSRVLPGDPVANLSPRQIPCSLLKESESSLEPFAVNLNWHDHPPNTGIREDDGRFAHAPRDRRIPQTSVRSLPPWLAGAG